MVDAPQLWTADCCRPLPVALLLPRESAGQCWDRGLEMTAIALFHLEEEHFISSGRGTSGNKVAKERKIVTPSTKRKRKKKVIEKGFLKKRKSKGCRKK